MKIVATLAALLLLASCATPAPPVGAPPVQPATPEQVAGCRYLDDVVGTSAWYGAFATQGLENARQDALARAAIAGATHIVWLAPTSTYGSSQVVGKAYRCS